MTKNKRNRNNLEVDSKLKLSQPYNSLYLLFLIVLPFVTSVLVMDQGLITRQLAINLFLLVLVFMLIYKQLKLKMKLDLSFLKFSPILFFVFFLLSSFLAYSNVLQQSEFQIVFSKYFLGFLFLILTLLLMVSNQLSFDKVSWALIFSGGIGLLIGIFQVSMLFSEERSFGESLYEVKSLFGHKNLFASFLFFIFPFFLLKVIPKGKLKLLILVSVTLISFLFLIQARAVLIAMFIFISLMFLLNGKKLMGFITKQFLIAGVGLLILSLFIINRYEIIDLKRITNLDSTSERITLWHHSMKLIEQNPVSGVGLGNWKLNYASEGLDDFPNFSVQQGMTSYQRPHNDFLWVFSEVGIVGGIFYILIFLSLFLMLIKLVRKKNQDQTEIQIWIAFLVAYCIVAFFDFPLERIEHQVVLWIAVARILHLYYMNFTLERRQTFLGNFILISSLLVGLLWSAVITKRYFEKEKVCHSVVLAHANSNWKEIVEWTADLDIQKQVDPFSTPLAWYRGVALVALKQNVLAKDAFEIALTVAPNHIHVLNNLASCYEKLGKHELAITFYEKALRISNKFDESILNLAAVYYNMGNYEQAFEVMKRCRDYVQDAKYQRFLPAIVRTKIDLILSDCKDEKHTERLNKIKENDQILIDYFVEHKKFNCTFNDYLLIHRKK